MVELDQLRDLRLLMLLESDEFSVDPQGLSYELTHRISSIWTRQSRDRILGLLQISNP